MKYKAGDKVRLRDDLVIGECYGTMYFSEPMLKSHKPGAVVTIEGVYSEITRTYTVAGSNRPWWTDEMFTGVVIDAAQELTPQQRPAFKVGDKVIGNKKANRYSITNEGWKGVITLVYTDSRIRVKGKDNSGDVCRNFDVAADCFDLLEAASPSPEPHTDWSWEDLF